MSEETPPEGAEAPTTFTQDDVNAEVEKIAAKIRSEERRKASEKYADYDDLKTKAAGAKTLEDRVAEIEQAASSAARRAEVAEVANEKGLTPSQAKRLVGSTREELLADADELLKDIAASKKPSNSVPSEGKTPTVAAGDAERRAFVRNLTGRD